MELLNDFCELVTLQKELVSRREKLRATMPRNVSVIMAEYALLDDVAAFFDVVVDSKTYNADVMSLTENERYFVYSAREMAKWAIDFEV